MATRTAEGAVSETEQTVRAAREIPKKVFIRRFKMPTCDGGQDSASRRDLVMGSPRFQSKTRDADATDYVLVGDTAEF